MDKYNEIIQDKGFLECLEKLKILEENRVFCRHDIEHFLALARIAYIQILENKLNYSKDVVYGIALLHDLGRVLEYENGIPHHEGSVIIGREILSRTTYSDEEINTILGGIESHRENGENEDLLKEIIKKSDKLSRNCFCCNAEKECYWSKEKKNFKITY
ncbi:MAG: HD domain-containing protein [Clostridium sp.]